MKSYAPLFISLLALSMAVFTALDIRSNRYNQNMENRNAYEYWIYTPLLDEFVTNDSESAKKAYKHFVEAAKKQPIGSDSAFVKQTRYGVLQKMYSGELRRELNESEIEAYIIKSEEGRRQMNKCFFGMRLALSSLSAEGKEKLMKEFYG